MLLLTKNRPRKYCSSKFSQMKPTKHQKKCKTGHDTDFDN